MVVAGCHGGSAVKLAGGYGTYSATPGPDWGWRIDLIPEADGVLHMVMHNITPDGREVPAVDACYRRSG